MQKYKYEEVLLNQKLPGELEMDSTTTTSSFSFFVEGKRHKTNPKEKISKSSMLTKCMETSLHILFRSLCK